MSAETEIQNIPSPTTEQETSSEKNIIMTCGICQITINDGDTKLKCKSNSCGAFTCNTCIELMINVMFGHPTLNYPLLCGVCQEAFDLTEVDEILREQQCYEQYISCVLPLFWSKDCLQDNEKLAQCPFCPYVEIHTTDACPLRFLTCQHPSCRKKSCLICLHEIVDDESLHESRCIELQSYKEMVEKAIESGSKQQCPHCQLTGIKDDGCTHMVCERCQLTWCYLCGMKEEECLVDEYADQNLSAHNQDWEQHEGRCPMSLVSINDVDNRWPQDDQDCLEYFHRYRTLCQLYDVFKIIGDDKLDELNSNFGIIDASGYTIDEIKDYENRILINYASNG
ncbi:unnamed protein product [Adineta steineri]|uniref:RING-type domain-containing protein n=2 Tax=Adineta steineri TaxID=433720 RepID=A0A814XQV1_9BILA|nr:unnamed protein product [Adineta steineri]CAF3636633.1 unnamed protein product [Adineta steineri]